MLAKKSNYSITWPGGIPPPQPPGGVKEFYFVLIIDAEKPPWILTRNRFNQNLIKGLTHPGLFKPSVDAGRLLSKGIGWLSLTQLKNNLEFLSGYW